MEINEMMKRVITDEGRTQRWVVKEMNKMNPSLKMTDAIFSAVIKGKRRVMASELITFCKVMERDPEIFMEHSVS